MEFRDPDLLFLDLPAPDFAAGRSRSIKAHVPSPHAAATSRFTPAQSSLTSNPLAHAIAWTIGGLHIGGGEAAASSSSWPREPDSASNAATSSPTRHVATGVALDWSHLHTAQSSPPDTTSWGLWSRNTAPAAMFSWPFFSVLTSAPLTDVSSPMSTTTISPPSSAAHMRRPFLSTHTELTSSLLNA